LITCSVHRTMEAISGLVFPSHTMVATSISFGLNCSRGDMAQLLLFKYGGCQDYAFAPLLDSRAQKKRAQVLFNGAGTDAEFRSDLFIAAALNQQVKNLLVAAGDFDLIEVQHFSPSSSCWNANAFSRSTSFAKASPV
jgi:hypothetical protein